jgi:hypothetical protein
MPYTFRKDDAARTAESFSIEEVQIPSHRRVTWRIVAMWIGKAERGAPWPMNNGVKMMDVSESSWAKQAEPA